jgi:transposase-like protein
MFGRADFAQVLGGVMTQILHCKCPHKDQDALYGPGRRVHNQAADAAGASRWRCSVCESVKYGQATPGAEKKARRK